MILLDANIPVEQKALLEFWRIHCRQIGDEVAPSDIADENILVLLHQLKRPTFFTRDRDFFRAKLAHPKYCLVWVDAGPEEAAHLIRRFLRHPQFRTASLRMGIVARVNQSQVQFWKPKQSRLSSLKWSA